MPKILPIAVLVGIVAGLLVGGFHNIFTVPVMERAIALEEERAAAEMGGVLMEEEPLVSLGVQRIGMIVGTGIFGAVMGLVFAGGYVLLRRIVPNWSTLALALTVGALGFWAISLFPFIKYPLNPPGIGEESSLTYRQGYQFLFMFLSALGVVGLLLGLLQINSQVQQRELRIRLYGALALIYAVGALIIVFAIPGNPDPTPVPIDLLELFRALSMIGQFLLWTLMAVGVALTTMWYERTTPTSRRARANVTAPSSH